MNYTADEKGLVTSYFNIPIQIEIPINGYRIKPGIKPIPMTEASYGEFPNTKGADGDPVDCYVGMFPDTDTVYVINQQDKDGGFDEHKVMIGFLSRDDAVYAYSSCTNGFKPLSVVSCTAAQLNWWLKRGNKKQPVTTDSFLFDPDSENAMEQNIYNWEDPDRAAAKALYDMRHTDTDEQLLEAAIYDCVIDEIVYNENGNLAVFDSLILPKAKLEKSAITFGRVFNRFGDDSLQVAENGIQISEPFRKSGTTNVAMIFEMTDGQTVTCFMHNPDKTPNQLKPDDILIAWRWLLNKKDITILVAPENGKDQNINEIGRRIMAFAKKNMKRFADANARRAQQKEENRVRKERIETKKATLQELVNQIENIVQKNIKNTDTTATNASNPVISVRTETENSLQIVSERKAINPESIKSDILDKFVKAYEIATQKLNEAAGVIAEYIVAGKAFDKETRKFDSHLIAYEGVENSLDEELSKIKESDPDIEVADYITLFAEKYPEIMAAYNVAESRLITIRNTTDSDNKEKEIAKTIPEAVNETSTNNDKNAERTDTEREITPEIIERFANAYIKTTQELNQASDSVEKILRNEVKFDDPILQAISIKKAASLVCHEALNKKLSDNVSAVSDDYPELSLDDWFNALEKSKPAVIQDYIDAENRLIKLLRICESDDELKPESIPEKVKTTPAEAEEVIQTDQPALEVDSPSAEPKSIPSEPNAEPNTTVPSNENDIQFLNNIIAGNEDTQASSFDAKLEEIAVKYEGSGNEQMEKLLKDAVDAYAKQTDVFDQLSA
jgi:hypothetical protein